MLLYDNIDEYLETRDLITMRISQLKRMEKRMEQRQGNDDVCISGRQSQIPPTVQNNTKSHSYYFALKKKEEFLESELKKVKKELKTIKKNSLL
jgi:dTDP-4-amino-4,6-dideoxygalactose transaminase